MLQTSLFCAFQPLFWFCWRLTQRYWWNRLGGLLIWTCYRLLFRLGFLHLGYCVEWFDRCGFGHALQPFSFACTSSQAYSFRRSQHSNRHYKLYSFQKPLYYCSYCCYLLSFSYLKSSYLRFEQYFGCWLNHWDYYLGVNWTQQNALVPFPCGCSLHCMTLKRWWCCEW